MFKVIPQTTHLDRAIAIDFFGWRWLAFRGRPTKDHPAYDTPEVEQTIVRRFFPALKDMDRQWDQWFERNPTWPADGTEALCYSYCSMNAPHRVPGYSHSFEDCRLVEKEIAKRKLWTEYTFQLLAQVVKRPVKLSKTLTVSEYRRLAFAKPADRCVAALAVIGSKLIAREGEEHGSEGT